MGFKNSIEFFDEWIRMVGLGKKAEFYNSLPDFRSLNTKPLQNTKIRKIYKN